MLQKVLFVVRRRGLGDFCVRLSAHVVVTYGSADLVSVRRSDIRHTHGTPTKGDDSHACIGAAFVQQQPPRRERQPPRVGRDRFLKRL